MNRNHKIFLGVVVILAAICITAVEVNHWLAERRQAVKLGEMVRVSVDAAGAKNQTAFSQCKTEIDAILAQQFPELERQGDLAAKDVAAYSACCKLVAYLAWDKVKGTSTAMEFVNTQLETRINPVIIQMASDLDSALRRLDLALSQNSVSLASELAQMNPQAKDLKLPVVMGIKSAQDIDKALTGLGINGVALSLCVPLDCWALLNTKVLETLVSKIAAAAAKVFVKPIGQIAAEILIALADGPLPIGDIIALAGGLWTAYDIYSTQKEFERDMKGAVAGLVSDAREATRRQVLNHADAILRQYQVIQEQILQQATKDLF